MLRFIIHSAWILFASSHETHGDIMSHPVGGQLDTHNCLISGGYTYCESTRNCIRQWETPCQDNFNDCGDCLKKQRNGYNIACPSNCDIVVDPPIYYPTDPIPLPPVPPPTIPDPIVHHSVCPEVMCMMYCENGFNQDENGCDICICSESTDLEQCDIPYNDCDNIYACPKVTEITQCSNGGLNGYTTYQLSVSLKQNMNIKNIYAVYGDEDKDDGSMYLPPAKNIEGVFGSNIGGVSQELININPDSQYDSWLTIGITDGDNNNEINMIGVSLDEWSETNSITVVNGAVFRMDPDLMMDVNKEIILGQITIPTGESETAILNIQGKFYGRFENTLDNSWKEVQMCFVLNQPNSHNGNNIPLNCVSWFDGCNTCQVNNGVLGACTRMMCFREGEPYCISTINGH